MSAPTRTPNRTEATKGGTVFSLEQSVTEHLDPQRIYVGRDISNLEPAGLPQPGDLPARRDRPDEGRDPDPGPGHRHRHMSNEDATEWSFTLKDGPIWQDGKPVTCEDLKYGVSRTFATDVITGGPNYIIGYLDIPEDADGTPVYKGPYTGEGQDAFDKAVTCDGNTHHLPLQEAVAGLPAAPSRRCGVRPLPRPTRTRATSPTSQVFSNGPYMLEGEWNEDPGGTFVRNPEWDGSRGHQTVRPTRTSSSIPRSVSRPRSSSTADRQPGDDQNAITTRNVTAGAVPADHR